MYGRKAFNAKLVAHQLQKVDVELGLRRRPEASDLHLSEMTAPYAEAMHRSPLSALGEEGRMACQ